METQNQIVFTDNFQETKEPVNNFPPQQMPQPPMPAQEPQTAAPVGEQIKYAGFWIRYVAAFIDGLVLIIPNIIVTLLFRALSLPTLGSIFFYIMLWGYYIIMTKRYGATLGKRAMGISVYSDKNSDLSWGQLILRETIGKIVSSIILLIGYIMAGFTKRKQALHDKIASTVVVYNDPNAKTPVWAIVIALILPFIAIIGLLASIVLVSLSAARTKANDALIKSDVSSAIVSAIMYQDEKGTLTGFVPSYSAPLPACSGQPIVNISPDGKNIAIFAKLCSSVNYFCDDTSLNYAEVNGSYAKGGKDFCTPKPTH